MLPKSSFDFPPYKPVDDCIVGFGFDGKAKTYKVVKLVSFEGDGDDWFNCGEVYTLSSGCWRFLPVGGEVRDVELFGVANISMYTHDGVFHWKTTRLMMMWNPAGFMYPLGDPFLGYVPPWVSGKNNELLIRTAWTMSEFDGSPFLYDFVTQKGRELKLSGEPNFIYKQSLVSVTGGN
ncbi:hypothetical protein RHGRI_013643 [Rhododendron griersonianum]|uniref:F-box protein n=1 Tax=Rhododendron griersonianum TaxID=479676 RepID=A0AAV6K6L7_9ERIC|nr:hypothetical protein RHGRI_013643 [Rhododendron griersonianum]